jgi:hypothetical protein
MIYLLTMVVLHSNYAGSAARMVTARSGDTPSIASLDFRGPLGGRPQRSMS